MINENEKIKIESLLIITAIFIILVSIFFLVGITLSPLGVTGLFIGIHADVIGQQVDVNIDNEPLENTLAFPIFFLIMAMGLLVFAVAIWLIRKSVKNGKGK